MKRLTTFICAVSLLCGSGLLAPAFGQTDISLSSLLLKAEAEQDPVKAIPLWQQLIDQSLIESARIEGMNTTSFKQALFQVYLDAARKTKRKNYVIKARELLQHNRAATTEDKSAIYHQSVFKEILVAEAARGIEPSYALSILKSTKELAERISKPRERSEAYHALAVALLVKKSDKNNTLFYGWDGLEIAEDLLPNVILPIHHAHLAHELAKVQPTPETGPEKALQEAMRIEGKKNLKKRNRELFSLYRKFREEDRFDLALRAILAVMDAETQRKTLYKWFKESYDAKEYSQAALIAQNLNDGRYAANSWAKLAQHYAKTGQIRRAEDAQQQSYEFAKTTRDYDRRLMALSTAAEMIAESGNTRLAQLMIEEITIEKSIGKSTPPSFTKAFNKAKSALAKKLAETDQLTEAEKLFSTTEFQSKKDRYSVVSALAKRYAESGDVEKAEALLSESSLPSGEQRDRVYYAIFKAYLEQNNDTAAQNTLQKIESPAIRMRAEAIEQKKTTKSIETEDLSDFFRRIETQAKTLNVSQRSELLVAIAKEFSKSPSLPFERWRKLGLSADAKDDLIGLQAMQLGRKGNTTEASRLMLKVDDARIRAIYFRQLSKLFAVQNDKYGLFSEADPILDATYQTILEHEDNNQKPSEDIAKQFAQADKKGEPTVLMATPKPSKLGFNIPALRYPERLAFDHKYVRSQLPPLTPFAARRIFHENSFFINTKFKLAVSYSDDNMRNGNVVPTILYIESGVTSLPALYEYIRSRGWENFIERNGNDYILHRALLIGPDATLVIDGDEVDTLYMSKQASAILVNAGELFITNTKVIGWDLDKKKPAYATFKNRYDFRPFLASWSRSKTYIAGNEMIALGYNNHKSYGISLSAGPERLQLNTITEPKRPTGIIVDNSFDNVYYGFYSYEADNVSLVGNEYNANIVYGIDPHDRSNWLTIAYNTAYHAEKKHGIIISREVNNSNYIGNLSFDNKGSGFMIDRLSTGTLVYANTAFGNKQDGLTLFESSCNFIASNQFFDNRRMGIRVRNSQDNGLFFNELYNNRQGAVYAYNSELLDDPAHRRRNFTLDPYSDVTALSMVGNRIENNGAGLVAEDVTALTLRANRFINQSPRTYDGNWLNNHPYFSSQYDVMNQGIVMSQQCPKGKWIEHRCRFRQDGFFAGDGQANLQSRIEHSPCQTVSKQDAK